MDSLASAPAPSARASWFVGFEAKLRRYAILLRKWWWIVLLFMSVGSFLGALLSWNKPTTYFSSGRMMVGGRVNVPEGASYNEEMSNFFGTQIELMQSVEVRRRAAERVQTLEPGVEPCPVQVLVSLLPRTSIFILNATGEKPAYTQKLLNACMDEYINMKKEMRAEKSESTATAITDEIVRKDKEVRAGEDELMNYQKLNNVGSLQEEAASASQFISSMKRQLAELKSEQKLLEMLDLDQNIDRAAKNAKEGEFIEKKNMEDSKAPMETLGPVTEYLRAKQQVALLQAERDEFSKVLRPKHPTIINLDQQIAQQQTMIATFRTQTAERLVSRRESIALQIQNISNTITEWDTKLLALNERLAEYNRIKSKVDRNKSIYEQLVSSSKSIDVSRNIEQDVVSVLERATPAQARKPSLLKGIFSGIALGFALAAAILFVLDQIDDRMNSISELRSFIDEDVLSQIPREGGDAKLRILEYNDSRHAFAESFRALRSSIIYMPVEGTRPKTILITSAIPNEGKSTVAINLAITLAFSDAKVLLVDGDLRRGAIHEHFQLDNAFGIQDVLMHKTAFKNAVLATNVPNLFLIPRGPVIEHPGELYLGKNMDQFLKEIYNEYDYIVFDSSPVMVADDTTSLAPKIDATLFVIRFAFSSARRSKDSISMLKSRQANVMGIVCNAVLDSLGDYYTYGSYYGYGPAKAVAE